MTITKNQTWAIITLAFALLLSATVGGLGLGISYQIRDILQSPAATSTIDVDADIMLTATRDGELLLEYIRLNRIQGEFNSKIIDLIMMGMSEW